MAGVPLIDLVALGVRAIFIAGLLVFVVAALWALRASIITAAAPAAPSMNHRSFAAARLTLIATGAGLPAGQVVPLIHGLVMGRRPECDVVLNDDAVSGRHVRFMATGDGWQMEDLESRNGTYVNRRRATAPTVLQPGDVVTAGTTEWRFDAA